METVDVEVGIIWKNNKQKNDKKLKFSIKKLRETKTTRTTETFKVVIVGDKGLEVLESKETNETVIKPRVYSNIELDENQENILLLPPNHQTFPRLSLATFETEMEKCMIKATWEAMRKSINYEKKHAEDKNDDDKDVHVSDKDYDHDTKTLDLRNLKATDLKGNKRVIVSMNLDDEKEISRNNVLLELKKS